MKITLLYGLPGSGKSYHASQQKFAKIIDVDHIRKKNKDSIKGIMSGLKKHTNYILDGLFTTNKQVEEVFAAIHEKYPDAVFEIIFWEKDIESCLFNDKHRRTLTSEASIRALPFEELDKKLIKSYGIKVIKKKIIRKPESAIWAEQEFGAKDNKLVSSAWCVGGSAGGYDGSIWPITPDIQPDFTELDNFLEKTHPNITFMQYKRLLQECVTIENYNEGDYYGGVVTYAKYVCDLEKLFNFLKKNTII